MIGKEHCATLELLPTEYCRVGRWDGLLALTDQLEQRLVQARKQVDKLTLAMLARAFAGQLVPQNPADEPAEKLSELIKQGEP